MPEHSGKLTKDEIKKAEKWISDKAGESGLECPVCKKTDFWGIDDLLIALENPRARDVYVPVISLVCGNCGHFYLHSAVKAGIVTTATEDE